MDWYLLGALILVIVTQIALLFVSLRKPQDGMTDSEKIALTKRLLENLSSIVLSLVTQAEIQYGDDSGKLKRSWVIDQLYKRIPEQFKAYVTEDNLNVILEIGLSSAKKLWGENPDILR